MEQRMAKVEVRIEEMQKDISEIKCKQDVHNAKLDNVLLLIAETKGAARLGKWFIGIVSTLGAGLFGYAGSKMALAGKVTAAIGTQLIP
jgi:hypothetical protein